MIDSLSIARELIYNKCNFDLSELKTEKESNEYEACTFKLNGKLIIHRCAKITPTKIGQFVTIWKRNENGQTEPFHNNDDFEFIIISARSGDLFGQFIFPKSILLQQGIISNDIQQGKRGIRVYPSWDLALNKQAKRTQLWQLEYFIEATDLIAHVHRTKQLLGFD